jgi:hypothetical protein
MTRQPKLPNPFPLKIAAFELYMVLDDRPLFPMTCHFPLRFSGRLDPKAFEKALSLTLQRHPMLAANVKEIDGDLNWVAAEDIMPPIDYGKINDPLQFPNSEQIDLYRETGLRIWVRTGEDRVLIQLQIHHACTDGAGAYQFVEDLLCAYHYLAQQNAERPDAISWRAVDLSLIADRNRLGLTRWQMLRRLPADVWGFVYGFGIFLLLRPAALASPGPPEPSEDELNCVPEFVTHSFAGEQVRDLIAAAKQSRGTLTDLVLRDVFLGMDDWNRRHGALQRTRPLRIMVPTDLRGPRDANLPACNLVGMYNLDRFMWMFRKAKRLMTSIRLESRILKFFNFGISFVRTIQVVTYSKWWTAKMLRTDITTTVVSNVGRLFTSTPLPRSDGKLVCGDMVLDEVECAPPVRSSMNATFALVTYAGKCTLMMNYDRRNLTRQAAESLKNTIVSRLNANLTEQKQQG